MTEPTAEKILEWFVDHIEVAPFELGGKIAQDERGETQWALTYVLGSNPRQTYFLAVSRNVYDEACLGELAAAINAARKVLGRQEVESGPNVRIIQKAAETR